MGQIFNRRLFISETINDTIIPLVTKQLEKFYISDNLSTFSEDILKSMKEENIVSMEGNNSKIITNNKQSVITNMKESFDAYLKNAILLNEISPLTPNIDNNSEKNYTPNLATKLPIEKPPIKQEPIIKDIPDIKVKISNEFFKNVNSDMTMPTMISVDVNINGQEFPVMIGTKVFIQKISAAVATKFGDIFVSDNIMDITKSIINKFKFLYSTEDKFNKTIHRMFKNLLIFSKGSIIALTDNELKSKQRFGIFLNSIEINDYTKFKKKMYDLSGQDIKFLNNFGLDYILVDESSKQVVNFYSMNSSDIELKVLTYDQLAKSLNYELKDLETLEKTTRIFMGNLRLPSNFNISKNSVMLRG